MEQLSRPYQIALGAILVLALAWFTVLKPSGEEPAAPAPAASTSGPAPSTSSGPTAPGVEGLGRAVDKADGAAAQSDASAKATQDAAAAASGESPEATPGAGSASGGAPGESGGGTTPDRTLEPGDASRPILADLEADKVVVVLFYNPRGADDRAVRRALKGVSRFKGKVRVREVPVSRVADYPAITQGVPVTQAPTILVMNREKQAQRLVGYQDTRSIEQLVADVGASGFADSAAKRYRTRVLNVCGRFSTDPKILAAGADDYATFLAGDRNDARDALREIRGLDPPRGYSAFHDSLVAVLDKQVALFGKALRAERAKGTGQQTIKAGLPRYRPTGRRFDRLARAKRMSGCA